LSPLEGDMVDTSAPPGLGVVEAFVNTNDVEAGEDELMSPDLLKAWLGENGLLGAEAEVGGADLVRAREVREGLRALLAANAGEAIDARVVEGLNRIAADVRLLVTFGADGSAGLAPGAAGVDGAIARILAAVYTAMADGTWPRLKACLNDTCRWAFYDRSKNQSRRWCSMSACGNVVKARTYRARHAAEHAHA
jgi:predicted RNA-binding Zn ribbon-like protein